MESITTSTKETQQVAADLVKRLGGYKHRGALALGLQGELGSGKTTFIQGLGRALKLKDKILSPTFVIQKRFTLKGQRWANLYHIDAYRLSGAKDLKTLGWLEILKDKKNLVVVEWAERVKAALPKDTLWLKFDHLGEDKRKIKIKL